jgi:Short C-terminal domain
MGHPSQDLNALVELAGGVESLAMYLDLPSETVEVALAALPGDAKTDRVARMVAENTWKLTGMPSQGGRIWRFTRKRVVKDWLILARRSAALGGQPHHQEEEEDDAVRLRVQVVTERFDELWDSSANPLMRESSDSPPGDLEQALIRYVGNLTSVGFAMAAMDNNIESEEAQTDEMRVLILIAASGYVWRAAERETLPELPPLQEVTFAVKWMNDHPNEADTERFERLAKAIFWTLSSGGSLALPDDSQVDGEAVLDVGFDLIAEAMCERAGFDPDTMLVADDLLTGDDGMRSAFKAGVALRELESDIGFAIASLGESVEPVTEAEDDAEAPGSTGTVEDLQRLAELHANGALTDREFAAAKAQLLFTEASGDESATYPAGGNKTQQDIGS